MDELLPWFVLKNTPGVGNLIFKRLMDRFGSPKTVQSSSVEELVQINGISKKIALAIKRRETPGWIKKELSTLDRKPFRIITQTEPDFPFLLLQIPDPPPFLYVYGELDPLSDKVAVVGSRNATGYGISTARMLSRDLASNRITIVSGMARGIDTAAHMGALDAKGSTIAVLGSGFHHVYPKENIRLFHKIAENGAVISEFSLDTPPDHHHFPIRNRIISGLSLGAVIVEAAKKSGSLITARLSAEQNREVFAVPGSITSYKSSGTHALIKQGAKLVEHVRDIFEEIGYDTTVTIPRKDKKETAEPINSLDKIEAMVLKALEPYPVHIDTLSRKLSILPGQLSATLLQLEIKGLVRQDPGKRFSRQSNLLD